MPHKMNMRNTDSRLPNAAFRSPVLPLIGVLAAGLMLTRCDNIAGLDQIGGTSEYVGASICMNCHREVHAAWSQSKHAHALDALRDAGQESNGDCLPCHATGYGQRGFVSRTLTPGMAGVQCEACHGPGARHVGSRKPADILRVPNSATCGLCHTGASQPQHEELRNSAHYQSLETIRNAMDKSDSCLVCHSLDYQQAVWRNESRVAKGLQPIVLPSITDDSTTNNPIESVGCGSCHHPHGSGQSKQLRFDPIETCAQCHTDRSPSTSTPPHSPQSNILSSTGGLQLDASTDKAIPFNDLLSIHGTVVQMDGCFRCHGVRATQAEPTDANPNLTGHTFEVSNDNCLPCHNSIDANNLRESAKADIAARVAALRQRIASVNRASLPGVHQGLLDAAAYNIDFVEADPGNGSHNARYVRNLLNATTRLLDRIGAP